MRRRRPASCEGGWPGGGRVTRFDSQRVGAPAVASRTRCRRAGGSPARPRPCLRGAVRLDRAAAARRGADPGGREAAMRRLHEARLAKHETFNVREAFDTQRLRVDAEWSDFIAQLRSECEAEAVRICGASVDFGGDGRRGTGRGVGMPLGMPSRGGVRARWQPKAKQAQLVCASRQAGEARIPDPRRARHAGAHGPCAGAGGERPSVAAGRRRARGAWSRGEGALLACRAALGEAAAVLCGDDEGAGGGCGDGWQPHAGPAAPLCARRSAAGPRTQCDAPPPAPPPPVTNRVAACGPLGSKWSSSARTPSGGSSGRRPA